MTHNTGSPDTFGRTHRPAPPSRRDIDVATGILIGLHGYSERDAFDELVRATHRTGTGIASVARSLIAVARGRADASATPAAALTLWADALRGRAVYG